LPALKRLSEDVQRVLSVHENHQTSSGQPHLRDIAMSRKPASAF